MKLPFQKTTDEVIGVGKEVKKKRIIRVILFFLALLVIAGGAFAWKTGLTLDRISGGNANIFKSIVKTLPGVEKTLKGET